MEGQDNNYNINYAPNTGYDGPPEAKRPASEFPVLGSLFVEYLEL